MMKEKKTIQKHVCSILVILMISITMFTGCSQQVATDQEEKVQGTIEEQPFTYADTIAWDGEYDVVVVGFGGAGATAAIAAADAGASVLLTEKAPEGHEGGNTRYCAQLFVTAVDYDKALDYYKSLRGDFDSTSDVILETYVKGMVDIKDYLVSLGADASKMVDWTDFGVSNLSQEYPEFPGKDGIRTFMIDDTMMQSSMWKFLRANVVDKRSDKIDVWYEAPGKNLIKDPYSKTILGVKIEKNGALLNIRAKNGVVLATGGFENNQEMQETYLGISELYPIGTTYNTGDGITMAQEVGANLWHMSVYENSGSLGGLVHSKDESHVGIFAQAFFSKGSVVLVGDDGTRYMAEDIGNRHGHILFHGNWIMHNTFAQNPFVIFDEAHRLSGPAYSTWSQDNEKEIEEGKIIKADSISELAGKIGLKPEILENTIKEYNQAANTGNDSLGRKIASMTSFGEGPYYAMSMTNLVLNTQGGPERNENSEILDLSGKPIPHLYSAGELGGLTAHLYQGGGNIAECLIFGEIAGTNAAKEKDPIPVYVPKVKVESNSTYTLGKGNDNINVDVQLGENEYLGVGEGGIGGEVTIKVTMDGEKITAIEIVKHSETIGIGDKALEKLTQSVIENQTADVDTVSGATMSSKAFIEAVKDALSQVK